MTIRSLVLAGFLAGCATLGVKGQDVVKPRQAEALSIIWEVYGRNDAPPEILWVEGAELTCTDPNSGKPGFKTSEGCREGYTASPELTSVAYRPGDRFSWTTLAHECKHIDLARRGILDPGHTRTAEWAKVDAANDRLGAVGL